MCLLASWKKFADNLEDIMLEELGRGRKLAGKKQNASARLHCVTYQKILLYMLHVSYKAQPVNAD